MSFNPLYHFQTHPTVMIRTLPESSLVVGGIQATVCMAAPVPLAMLLINQILLDIRPTAESLFQGFLIAEVLVDVIPPYHVLGLHPPMEVVILMASVQIGLMDHGTIRTQALFRGFSHLADDGLHLGQHLRVAQHKGRLMHQPRALYIMAIALQMAGTTRPVHLEEQVQMVGLGIQDTIGEDINQIAQSALYPYHGLHGHGGLGELDLYEDLSVGQGCLGYLELAVPYEVEDGNLVYKGQRSY